MNKHYGFTLVELVMTIIIVGIMAVYAIPRLGSLAVYDLANGTDELVEAIRLRKKHPCCRSILVIKSKQITVMIT